MKYFEEVDKDTMRIQILELYQLLILPIPFFALLTSM